MNLPLVMYATLQIKAIFKKYDEFVKYRPDVINVQTVQNITIGVSFRQVNSSNHHKHQNLFCRVDCANKLYMNMHGVTPNPESYLF
jgi:hypothetical protein